MRIENGNLKKYKLGEILDFFNGKQRPKKLGKYPLYSGNEIVDYVGEYNYDDNIIIGRVGANCGCVQICNEQCWVSDNDIKVSIVQFLEDFLCSKSCSIFQFMIRIWKRKNSVKSI